MQRLGLALSGGGFRASLYHLGVIRLLRDAQILPRISHITSVSGGSIIGAHLVLNWDRYCGTDEEFQAASDELLHFIQLDVRNRILRRFPLASLVNICRRAVRRRSDRRYTRAGLLEHYYLNHLYGDTSLFQLPDRPRLHILATNLSEGALCAFYQGGLLLIRRTPGGRERFEQIHCGLATVPMAVAASSAFPGFFPPLELSSRDIGATEADFGRLAFTDGGIFDNLGLRMFRYIEQSSVGTTVRLGRDDVLDQEALISAIESVDTLPEGTPLRHVWDRVRQTLPELGSTTRPTNPDHLTELLMKGFWSVMRTEELYRDPVFEGLHLNDPRADLMLQDVNSTSQRPEIGDQVWLNRQIIESGLQQIAGRPCLRSGRDGFDGIFVSDAGASFKVRAEARGEGLMRTAIRSTDILMDRVNQLELESFRKASGIMFVPITRIVEKTDDSCAPHPEIQRKAALIRTDLDRCSDLEIKALVQHGYCVARNVCAAQTELTNIELPEGPPWNPIPHAGMPKRFASQSSAQLSDTNQAMARARQLQRSASRNVVRSLINLRDWPTYIWIPLTALVVFSLPYLLYKSNKTAERQGYVLEAIAETSPVYRKIMELISTGPVLSMPPVSYDEVDLLEEPDFTGFEILVDERIIDLRGWSSDPEVQTATPYLHARLQAKRTENGAGNNHLRFQWLTDDDQATVVCHSASLKPKISRMQQADGQYKWEMDLNFDRVPVGADSECVFESMVAPELAEQVGNEGYFQFSIPVDTALTRIWMLLPEGRNYDSFTISGFPIDSPDQEKIIVPSTTVELPLASIATFQLINPNHKYRYECRLQWDDDETSE